MDIATKNSIGTDFVIPDASLIGDDSLLISSSSITPQKSTSIAAVSALQSPLISSNSLTSSLSPTESIVYLNSTGISQNAFVAASTVPLNTDGSIPLVDQDNFVVGNMPTTLTFIGSNFSDDLYLKLDANSILNFSTDGINFSSSSSVSLAWKSDISINLGDGNDRLYVDESVFNALQNSNSKIRFDGGFGSNTIFGPALNTTWNITGQNSGNVGNVVFQNVTDLKAAAQNYATFVFSPDGSLSGIADGGDGDLGTLIIEGGNYQTSRYIADSAHSGSILLDQKLIRYDGLAPIIDNTNTVNRIFTATNGNDQIVIDKNTIGGTGDYIFINSTNGTFENVTYQFSPTGKLTVDAGGGDDTITVNWFDSSVGTSLEILGNTGNDSVIFAKSLSFNGGSLIASAENITVALGVVIDTTKAGGTNGNITFLAADTQTQSGLFPPSATSKAQVNLSGSTLIAGNVNISATSTVTGAVDNIAALVNLDSTASISVFDTRIESSGSVTLASSSIVTGSSIATGLNSQIDTSVDAAVAILVIKSSAVSNVSGSSSILSAGALEVTATNKVTATTSGDASAATAGAGIAIATVSTTTKAYIDSSSSQSISASAITLNADADNNITTTAKASPGGSTENDETPDDRTDGKSKTSDGAVAIAGALAFTKLTGTTEAYLASTDSAIGLTLAATNLDIKANSKNSVVTSADGSTTSSGSVGVGVAVAINVSDLSTKAYIGSKATLNVDAVNIQALTPTTNIFTAIAVSGAGDAGKVGVAGAIAVNRLKNSSQALLLTASAINLANGSISLSSNNQTSSQTKAESAQSGAGTLGIGASFALNVEDNKSEALIQDNVFLNNAAALNLSSTSDNSNDTSVKAGSAGGIAASPAVALAIVGNDSIATIGNGGLLTVASVDAKATHKGKATTVADGTVTASKVGLGAALALSFINDKTISTTGRNITSTVGDISFSALNFATSSSTAKASASGTEESKDDSETSEKQTSEQLTASDDTANKDKNQDAVKGKVKSKDSAAGNGGAIAVSAALGLNVVSSTANATLGNGLIINAAGAFKLASSNETDAAAIADGSAVGTDGSTPKVGVGVGVALNIVNSSNQATIGTGAQVIAEGVTLEAKISDASVGGDGVSDFKVEATAGAGAKNVGIAGAFALNLVNNSNEAVIRNGATINAGAGDIELFASSNEVDDLKATANAKGGKVGVGGALGLSILTSNSVRAEVEDAVTLSGGGKLTIEATSERTVNTKVEAGTSGGIAVSPGVAIAIVNNDTKARLGSGSGTLNLTGGVTIKAQHSGSVLTSGNATAAGDKVAAGAIVAVNVAVDNTIAALDRGFITSGGDVVVSSSSILTSNAIVLASASGNKDDGRKSDSEASAQSGRSDLPSAEKNVDNSNTKASDTSGGTGGSGVGVAAAVGVNWQVATNKAIIGNNLSLITKGGGVTVSATSQANAKSRAIGTSISDTAKANIGAAVAINVADVSNVASVGTQSIIDALDANGKKGDIKISAVTPDGNTNEFVVWGLAAAGSTGTSGKLAIAGSVGVNVLKFNNQALVGSGAQIATLGSVSVTANNPVVLQNLAIAGAFSRASGAGGAVGAAVAVNILNQNIEASIGTNVIINASESIAVSAKSSLNPRVVTLDDMTEIIDAVTGKIASLSKDVPGIDQLFAKLDELAQPIEDKLRTLINNGKANSNPIVVAVYEQLEVGLDALVDKKTQGLVDLQEYVTGLIELAKEAATDFFKDLSTAIFNLLPFSTIAIGGGVTQGKAGVGGSVIVDVFDVKTLAYLSSGAQINQNAIAGTDQSLSVIASDTTKLINVAGGLGAAKGSVGIGIGVDVEIIGRDVRAYIDSPNTTATKVKAANGVKVNVSSNEDIFNLTLAAGVADTAGIAGSISVNQLTNTVKAGLSGTVDTQGDVKVIASDTSTIEAIAGGLAISADLQKGGTKAAIGAAIAINNITTTLQATLTNADVRAAGDLTANATSKATIKATTLAGAASVSNGGSSAITVAGEAAAAVNTISSSILANISNGSTIKVGNNSILSIAAIDQSTINATAGGGALALSASDGTGVSVAIGVSVAKNAIDTNTNAYIDSSSIGSLDGTDVNLDIQALTNSTINAQSVAVAVAVAKAQNTGVAISGGGAFAFNAISTKTNAYVNNSNLSNLGDISISANNTSAIDATVVAISGSVTIGADTGVGAAIGAAIANNFIGYTENGDRSPAEVQAYIQNSSLTANGALTLSAINDGTINAKVGAGSAAISGGGTTGVAASGSGVSTQNKIATLIRAFIDGDGTTGIQSTSASLAATDTSKIKADAGAASIAAALGGTTGVSLSIGVALANNLISNEVEASIKNADNFAKTTTGGISISATTAATIEAIAVAASLALGAGGTTGVAISGAGAGAVNTILTKTNAYISNSNVISAGGVSIDANNTAKIDATIVAVSASVGVGGTAGVGVSIGAAVANNYIGYNGNTRQPAEVQAYIQNSSLTANGALTLNAIDSATINAKVGAGSAAISGGGTAGVAASGSGVDTQNKVATLIKAFIDGDGATGIQVTSASLTAEDTSKIKADAGAASIAAALGGTAGVSLSIGVALANNLISNDVEASIKNADNFVKATTGGISISATTGATIDAIAVAASLAVGAGGTAGVAISGAGAGAVNTILTKTNAYLSNSNVNSASGVSLNAQNSATINATIVAASAAVGGGGTAGVGVSIGASVANNYIGYDGNTRQPAEVQAYIQNSSLIANGVLTLNAIDSAIIKADVFAGSAAVAVGGAAGVAASGSGVDTKNKVATLVKAFIDGDGLTGIQSTNASLTATDSSTITANAGAASLSVAGGGAAGVGGSIGVSLASNLVSNEVEAAIKNADNSFKTTSSGIAIAATTSSTITATSVASSLAVGVGASAGVGISGAGAEAVNVILTKTNAYIDSSNVISAGLVSLESKNNATIKATIVAASAALGGGIGSAAVSIGAATSNNLIGYNNGTLQPVEVQAYIQNSSVNATGALTLKATNDAKIDAVVGAGSVAVAAGIGGGSGAGAGVSTENKIATNVKAFIDGDGATGINANSLSITAEDTSTIKAGAEAVSVAATFAIGGAVSISSVSAKNTISNNVQSFIQNADNGVNTTVGDVKLSANEKSTISSTSVGAAISVALVGLAGAGAESTNTITNTAKTYIGNSNVQAQGNVSLTSTDDSTIQAFAGQLSAGTTAALGASLATNNINNQIIAEISQSAVTSSNGNVELKADSKSKIEAISAGGSIGVVVAATYANTTNNISNKIYADINGASIINAQGNVTATATNDTTINSLAGQITGAGLGAAGAATAINNSSSETRAYVDDSLINASLGKVQLVAKDTGVIVSKSAGASIGAIALTGSVSVNNMTNTINANAQNAQITSGAGGVEISAIADAKIDSLAGQLSIGLAGVGGAVAFNNIGNTVTAYIITTSPNQATINTTGNVLISANNTSKIETTAVSGSIGLVAGIGGSVAVNQMNNQVLAYAIGSNIKAQGSVAILANSTNEMNTNAGALSGGLLGGLGATIAVNNLANITNAYADDSTIFASGLQAIAVPKADGSATNESLSGVAIIATNKDTLTNTISTLGVGLGVGVAGSVVVNSFSNTTQAYANNSVITATGLSDVYIKALNDSKIDVKAGALGAGLVAGAGIALDLTTMNNTTRAYIDSTDLSNPRLPSSSVTAGNDLVVNAKTQRSINSDVTAAGAALIAGIQGSVSIVNVNSPISGDGKTASGTTQTTVNSQLNDLNGEGKDSKGKSSISAKQISSGLFDPSASPQSETTAFITGVAAAGSNLTVKSDEITKLKTSVGGISIGLLAAGGSVGIANITHNTSAYIGANSQLAGGNINVQSTGFVDSAQVKTAVGSVGLVGLGAAVSYLTSNNNSKAYIGTNVFVDRAINININSESNSGLTTDAKGDSAGAVAAGVVIANTSENGKTLAYVDNGVQIGALGQIVNSLNIKAKANEQATSTTKAGAYGLVSGAGSLPSATVSPEIKAYIGNNNIIKVTGDVNVIAEAPIDADAFAKANSIALGTVGVAKASVNSKAKMDTYIGANTAIEASNVNVSSTVGKAPTPPPDLSFDPSIAVNNSTDLITLNGGNNGTGLRTGDTVQYLDGGGNDIGGLSNQNTYSVIRVDSNNDSLIKLGNEFNAATEVNTTFNTIKFANGHGFTNGQKVIYENSSNGSNVGGLQNGGIYYVKVVDGTTIQLTTNSAVQDDVIEGSNLNEINSSFNGTTLTVSDGSNNFNNGDSVIYRKRSALFTVDDQLPQGAPNDGKNIFNITSDVINSDRIHSYQHGFKTNDQVIYSSDGTSLTGLSNGQLYYVIRVDDDNFQLSNTTVTTTQPFFPFSTTESLISGSAVNITNVLAKGIGNKITAVGLKTSIIQDFTYITDNASNEITLSNHQFNNGDLVTYFAGSTGLSNLSNGQNYYVIKTGNDTFKLSNTSGGAVIDIGASNNTQRLVKASVDLVEGETYYVVNRSGNNYQLSTSQGGAAIFLDKQGLTGTGSIYQFVSQNAVDLTSIGSGTQNIHLDLTSVGATGTKHLLTFGNVPLPTQGDQVFSVNSQAASGGLLAVNPNTSDLTVTSTTNTYIGSNTSIKATGNVFVTSNSNVQVAGSATAKTFGLVAFGQSTTTVNVTNNNNTYVMDGVTINALGKVTVNGESNNRFNIASDSTAGAFIPIAIATSTLNLNNNNITWIGSGSQIGTTAGNTTTITSRKDLIVRSRSDTSGSVNSDAFGGGLVPFAYGTSNLTIAAVNKTTTQNAKIEGRTLKVEATAKNLDANAIAKAQSGGLIGIVNATSNLNLSGSSAIVNIGSGTALKADYMDIKAVFEKVNSNSTALARCDGLGGKTDSRANDNVSLLSKVVTDSGSTIDVFNLNVKSAIENAIRTNYAYSKLAWALKIWTPFGTITITLDFGSGSESHSGTSAADTSFNSKVNLFGRSENPVLIVGQNGSIVLQSANVNIANSTGTDIVVENINNNGVGSVAFADTTAFTNYFYQGDGNSGNGGSPSASQDNNRGTFVDNGTYSAIDPAFDSVYIENASNKNLIVKDINTIGSGGTATVDYANVNVPTKPANRNVATGSIPRNPTLVTVNNLGVSNLILQGLINNPHDRTILYSNGSIQRQGATQKVETRDLTITAKGGNIGANTVNERVNVKLIQGYSPVTAAVSTNTVGLSTEAQGSIYLDLATQELNNAPVTVNINKFNANTGEVNLNIASTTDQVGTAIASTYNFSTINGYAGINAGTNITIDAGSSITNIDATTGIGGTAIVDAASGGSIKLNTILGLQANVKRLVSSQGTASLSAYNVNLLSNAIVSAGQDVNLSAVNNLVINPTVAIAAVNDVFINNQGNLTTFDGTATITAGNNAWFRNQGAIASTTNINGLVTAKQLYVFGSTSDDTINIQRVDSPTYISTGDGNDLVNVGSQQPNGNSRLNVIKSALVIDGANQFDTLNVDDSGSTANTTGIITSSTITGFGMTGSIEYSNFENLNLNLGIGNDNVTVNSTQSGTTTINGNGGNDQFTVTNIGGITTIDGGSGTNQLFTNLPLSPIGLIFLDPNGAVPLPLSGNGGASGLLALLGGGSSSGGSSGSSGSSLLGLLGGGSSSAGLLALLGR